MEQRIVKTTIAAAVVVLLSLPLSFSQIFEMNAGANQIINWEKTHAVKLKGSVSSNDIKAEWTCPQNSDVVFGNASDPVTEVTFPRPGYFLLMLTKKGLLI
jgi:uncharacterized protein (DUF2147 family)